MSKKNGNALELQEFHFPQKKEKQSLGKIIHNKDDGTYFGRTPGSWAQLGLFYCIFYLVLAGLFTICLQGLFSTLNDQEPRWQLERSLIGTNPGLGFRPLSDETERGSVIQFSTKKAGERDYWKGLLNEFLEPYNGNGKSQKWCDFNETRKASDVCSIDTEKFGPCSPSDGYGYDNGRPCVFLKLNKIYNWEPEYYNDPQDLPENMPAELKEHISQTPKHERNQVWVSCRGANSLDQENLGPIKYYPAKGFPAYFYPYLNQNGYLSPLIAVQFEKITVNQMVNVECRAWAKNVIYSGSLRDRMGSVAFQLYVD